MDKLLFLENPMLKILLICSDKRSEWVKKFYQERRQFGKFHTLFPGLLQLPEKFFEYFRMQPGTFYYLLDGIKPDIKKHNNYRALLLQIAHTLMEKAKSVARARACTSVEVGASLTGFPAFYVFVSFSDIVHIHQCKKSLKHASSVTGA